MPRSSKINIFNVMTPEELDEALNSNDYSSRYYKRIVAMKLIAYGHSHKETSKILQIGYRTIYRWAKACEKSGLIGLKPKFNGGRKSKFSKEDRVKFQKILSERKNLSMTDAQNILSEEFNLDFTLPYVCRLVRDLGFNYGSPRPKFKEEPENAEEILKKNFEKAEITDDDYVLSLDESTIKFDYGTKKSIYQEGTKNTVKKPNKSITVNFLGTVGINTKSILMDIKNLTEFEFGKALFKIKIDLADDPYAIEQLTYILSHYDISKKEITEILEEYEDPFSDFDEKIERSLKNNRKDNATIKARKLGKHCKRVSTENKDKRKNVQHMHIYRLLNYFNYDKILKKTKRTVIHLDNVSAHKTDLIFAIAEKLNIIFVYNPKYTPRLNPTEKVWDILKGNIKRYYIESKEDLISTSHEIFDEKCNSDTLTRNFKTKYLSYIS